MTSPRSLIIFFLILLSLFYASNLTTATQWPQCNTNDHTTHLHFYMHDDYTGSNPTARHIITMPKTSTNDTSPRTFGDMVALNNILTEEPRQESKQLGRAQGFAVRVAGGTVNDLSLHLVFEQRPYEGSSISVHGRIAMDKPVRESVVVGGTGHFKFARGYMLSKNYDYNLATGGIMEFDVYVV